MVVAALLAMLPLETWERIAFYLATSDGTHTGPPIGIYTLALVSRHFHDAISIKNNSSLYGRLFRYKFDTQAPIRRLSERWLTTRCLASELIKRFSALKRIRCLQFEADDLWTAYLMLTENDGKNEDQLISWAGLRQYLVTLVMFREDARLWGTEPANDALIFWLLFMTASRESIAAERLALRRLTTCILHPFLVRGYRYPSFYAPDAYYLLPLCDEGEPSAEHFSAPLSPISTITHYSHKLTLCAPVIVSAALLATIVRLEEEQNLHSLPPATMRLPPNRMAASAVGAMGPTLEDVVHFHCHTRVALRKQCTIEISSSLYQDEACEEAIDKSCSTSIGSGCYDEDWSRLVACYDPWLRQAPLRGPVYKVGSLSGSWAGRIVHAGFDAQINLLMNPHFSPLNAPLHHQPLYWTLHEHHCLSPNVGIMAGQDDTGGDDILNAWLPRGITVRQYEDAVEVFDPKSGHRARYETFLSRSTAPYSKTVCEKLERHWISDGDTDGGIAEETLGSEIGADNSNPVSPIDSYIDNDDEYIDEISHKSSGVSDILITGETSERLGAAWGHYTILGRVRSWDGLIVLLRVPRNPASQLGQWVFKGYIHDQNFVGRWRETSTQVGLSGFEGSFVVSRAEDT